MSPEQWRPPWMKDEPGELAADTPEYWQHRFPDITRQEAVGMAQGVQLGAASEMFQHIQYDNLGESPYYQGDPEHQAIAPLIQRFARFVRKMHPTIPDHQVVRAIRAALYEPGVLDLVLLVQQMDEARLAASDVSTAAIVPRWFEGGVSAGTEG